MKRFALVVLLALAGCGGQAADPVLLEPVAETPDLETPRLPLTLPADLLLPHEVTAHRSGSGEVLYSSVCLDPPEELRDAVVDDGRAVWFEDAGGPTVERIALFVGDAVAAEAMSDLRDELALCGHAVDHVGNPHEFRVLPQPDLPHAHETLQWHTITVEGPESFVTVARLGNIVYLVDHLTEVRLDHDDALWREVIRAEKAVGSFALELCSHGYGRGCQEDPS